MGITETTVIAIIAMIKLLPFAAVVWALVMLHRIRVSQDALRDKVDRIERLVQRP